MIGIDVTNPVHITQQIKLASSVCKTTPYISQKVKQFADVQILKRIIENVPCLSSTGLLDQIRYSCLIEVSDMFFTGEIKRRAALMLVCMMCDVRINADLCFMIQHVFREDPHLKETLCCSIQVTHLFFLFL